MFCNTFRQISASFTGVPLTMSIHDDDPAEEVLREQEQEMEDARLRAALQAAMAQDLEDGRLRAALQEVEDERLRAALQDVYLIPAARRRLVGKQSCLGARCGVVQQTVIDNNALAAEAWTEVRALERDTQRLHVHYTHVRTSNPLDRQPDSFTREGFYHHMEVVYKEAYTEPANPSGSILLFGAVSKELHPEAPDETCEEHHHTPTYCSKRHYWKKVADLSYKKYKVKLNAVAHDGYYSMYSYITRPSSKKPLAELDHEVFLSEHHPRGRALQTA